MPITRIVKVYKPFTDFYDWTVSVKYHDKDSEFGKIKDKDFECYPAAWAYYKYKKTIMNMQNFFLGKIK